MYGTCIFCHGRLGANESIERFPVSRRLAFDAEKGRLWAICPRCSRWNLAPLEERWEAIEECERHFRCTTLRVCTENIGLAGLRDGTELVRVGRPRRPELAAWRYGRELVHRSRRVHGIRNLLRDSVFSAQTFAASVAAGFLNPGHARNALEASPRDFIALGTIAAVVTVPGLIRSHLPAVRVGDGRGGTLRVLRKHLRRARLLAHDGGLAVTVAHVGGATTLTADAGRRAAEVLLARINWAGARTQLVTRATEMLEERREPAAAIATLARQATPPRRPLAAYRAIQAEFGERGTAQRVRLREAMPNPSLPAGTLHHLLPSQLLALEMALHEEAERRALRGELASLRAAWREAEEVAAIADSLLPPAPLRFAR